MFKINQSQSFDKAEKKWLKMSIVKIKCGKKTTELDALKPVRGGGPCLREGPHIGPVSSPHTEALKGYHPLRFRLLFCCIHFF